jgi:hypothetical protein
MLVALSQTPTYDVLSSGSSPVFQDILNKEPPPPPLKKQSIDLREEESEVKNEGEKSWKE